MIKLMSISALMIMIVMMASAKNPMKTSIILLAMSAVNFFLLKLMMGSTWFPLIMFMLFTGGILMTFMILASILPNEKSLKSKIPKNWMIMPLILITINSMHTNFSKENVGEIKSLITSMSMFSILTGMILIYFFFSMNLNEGENSPMRSMQCC